jgi:hypothetical protein
MKVAVRRYLWRFDRCADFGAKRLGRLGSAAGAAWSSSFGTDDANPSPGRASRLRRRQLRRRKIFRLAPHRWDLTLSGRITFATEQPNLIFYGRRSPMIRRIPSQTCVEIVDVDVNA